MIIFNLSQSRTIVNEVRDPVSLYNSEELWDLMCPRKVKFVNSLLRYQLWSSNHKSNLAANNTKWISMPWFQRKKELIDIKVETLH